MVISANSKRKAAVDDMVYAINRTLEGACRKQRVVGRVERDRAKLLPVPHVRVFCEDLVQRNLALMYLKSANTHRPYQIMG